MMLFSVSDIAIPDALIISLIGIGGVFAILVILILLLMLFSVIMNIKFKKQTQETLENTDLNADEELVAVISSAIMAYYQTDLKEIEESIQSPFIIRSIKLN